MWNVRERVQLAADNGVGCTAYVGSSHFSGETISLNLGLLIGVKRT
jgi:hypothetical protein